MKLSVWDMNSVVLYREVIAIVSFLVEVTHVFVEDTVY